jgi:hypothetical protein
MIALINRREFDVEEGMSRAFEAITPDLVKACVKRSIYHIHNT